MEEQEVHAGQHWTRNGYDYVVIRAPRENETIKMKDANDSSWYDAVIICRSDNTAMSDWLVRRLDDFLSKYELVAE